MSGMDQGEGEGEGAGDASEAEGQEDDVESPEQAAEEVGPARACLPRHPPHFRPSFLGLNGIT
jgi:hypothetical protein